MILYLDTSSLLKIYLDEEYCDEVRAWARAADALATSRITLPEAAAALTRRRLQGGLTRVQLDGRLARIAGDWPQYMRVDVDELRAADVAVRRHLRGFDAVQLAAALTLTDATGPEELAFTSFDTALNGAAAQEGVLVLEP
ncbi:MAG TPA: type II toxin-antitoxin system VapC family toxin [Thermoleophilia bacterium]|nr:type II toxin-antitoxin system VapC family toxin [Thermoleophilia bacterium]